VAGADTEPIRQGRTVTSSRAGLISHLFVQAYPSITGLTRGVHFANQSKNGRGNREAGVNPAQSRYGDRRSGSAGSPVAGPMAVPISFVRKGTHA
jgi:hypothetical protein